MSKEPKKRAPTPSDHTFFSRYRWEVLLLICCSVLYANALFNQYNMDDELVTNHHRLTSQGISAIPDIFTSSYYEDASGYAYEYRPLVLASFAVEHQLTGDNPYVSHIINLLLYTLSVVLLYRMLLLLLPDYSRRLLFFIALLFAVHPAHTEVVCSIKNRDEILALLCGLLALYAAIRAVSGRYAWYAVVPVMFLLALMGKKTVMPLVVIIPCAIALCRPVRMRQVLGLGTLLALPVFVMLTDSISHKVGLMLLILGFIFLFYLLVVPGYLVERIGRFRAYYRSETAGATPDQDQSDVKSFLVAVLRDLQVHFSWVLLVVLVVCLGVFLGGLWCHYMPAVALVLAILTAGLWGNRVIHWWATLGIYICLSSCMIIYEPETSVFSDLLFIALAFQMLYSRGRLFLPSLALYIWLAWCGSVYSYINLGVVMLVLYRWPRIRKASYLVAVLGIYDSVKQFLHNGIFTPASVHTTAYSIYIAAIFLLPQLLHRGDKLMRRAVQISALLVLMAYTWPGLDMNTARIANAMNSRNDKPAATIAAVKQNRELSYVEEPVAAAAPLTVKAGTAMEVLLHYLHTVVVPYPMAFYYGYKFITPQRLSEPGPLVSLLCYLLLVAAALVSMRRCRLITLGLLIYLLSIAAVAGVFIPIPGMVAERYLLLPSLGWCIVLVTGLAYLLSPQALARDRSKVYIAPKMQYALGAIIALYAVVTFTRNFQWKDAVTLMRHDISYVDCSAQAHNLLAIKLMKSSYDVADANEQHAMHVEAFGHLKKALEIYPTFYNAAYDLGRVSSVLNMPDSTVYYFRMALAIDSANPDPSLFMGQTLIQQGKFGEAIPPLEYAIRHKVMAYNPYALLSMAYFKTARHAESIAVNKEAIRLWPADGGPYLNIARVYIAESKTDSAMIYLRKAQQVVPGDGEVQRLIQSVESGSKAQVAP